MSLFLSVALATYNGDRYIGDQLSSIACQTRLPDELIISDDASKDATLDIIRRFAESAPFPIKLLINPSRLGSTRNFEIAMQACSGDIIFLSDQDDIWYQKKILLCEESLINNPEVGGIFTDADLVNQDLNPLGIRLWKSLRFSLREQALVANGNAFSLLLKHFAATGITMAFRSKYLDYLLPIPEGWMHDAWIALLISAISRLSILPIPTTAYRQHNFNQYGGYRRRKHNQGKKLAEIFIPQAHLYKKAHTRLLELTDRIPNIENEVYHLGEKVNFLYERAELPIERWRRIPYIVRNLITLRYHRYGRGFIPFVNDFAR